MLESFRRLRSCCQTIHDMTNRDVDYVMTNHNEDKAKRGGRGLNYFPSRTISWLLLSYSLSPMKTNDHTPTTRKAIIGLTDWCTEHL